MQSCKSDCCTQIPSVRPQWSDQASSADAPTYFNFSPCYPVFPVFPVCPVGESRQRRPLRPSAISHQSLENTPAAPGLLFTVHRSLFTADRSLFTVHGSRFTVHGSRFPTAYGLKPPGANFSTWLVSHQGARSSGGEPWIQRVPGGYCRCLL